MLITWSNPNNRGLQEAQNVTATYTEGSLEDNSRPGLTGLYHICTTLAVLKKREREWLADQWWFLVLKT